MNSRIDFNKEIKDKMTPLFKNELFQFVLLANDLYEKSLVEYHFDPNIKEPKLLFNQYVDLLWSSYIVKLSSLMKDLIWAINKDDYLLYGLLGRAIIEHTAIIRFYDITIITPQIRKYHEQGTVKTSEIGDLINIFDRQLRGGRFEWNHFFSGNFEKLIEDERWPIKQERIGKCIEHWAKEKPDVKIYYDLFCDLVHPNLGSNLLIIKIYPDGGGFGGNGGLSNGLDIFIKTFKVISDMSKIMTNHINRLLFLRFSED
jgi:hypothetical protein